MTDQNTTLEDIRNLLLTLFKRDSFIFINIFLADTRVLGTEICDETLRLDELIIESLAIVVDNRTTGKSRVFTINTYIKSEKLK